MIPISRFRRLLAAALVAAAAVAVVALVAGPAPARAESPSAAPSPGTLALRIGWTSQPDNLNPFIGWQNVTYEIWSINYGFLFGFGNDNSPTLDLAREFPTEENGGISADGKVWTIKLRTGVKWSDGQPFSAEDVAFTYNYVVKNEMMTMAITTVGIEEAEALAPDVVQHHLQQAQGRHDAHLPADPAQARVGEGRSAEGPDELRQQAADRRDGTVHHHRVQAREAS